jgi:hypothetical protein
MNLSLQVRAGLGRRTIRLPKFQVPSSNLGGLSPTMWSSRAVWPCKVASSIDETFWLRGVPTDSQTPRPAIVAAAAPALRPGESPQPAWPWCQPTAWRQPSPARVPTRRRAGRRCSRGSSRRGPRVGPSMIGVIYRLSRMRYWVRNSRRWSCTLRKPGW